MSIHESDSSFVAPPEPSVEILSKREKIKFSNDIRFTTVDGNYNVLTTVDRELTTEDVDRGMYSTQDKIDFSFAKLLKGLPSQLHDSSKEMSEERRGLVESLKAGRPVFVPLESSKIDESFARAASQFPGARAGVILLPENGSKLNTISAVALPDGRFARLMKGKEQPDIKNFLGQLNNLTPSMEAWQADNHETAFAMEFIRDAERPVKITRQEMDDWLKRVERSSLVFDFDVGLDDDSLDNFVRKDGRLFWVDGNILQAQPTKDPDILMAFVEKQRLILNRYIKK